MANNITVYRGDDHTITLTFDDGTNPIDLTGQTIFFTVKSQTDTATDDTSALITKDVTSHSDPTNGITTVTLTTTDTDQTAGVYKYDIQKKTAGGSIQTALVGTFTVVDDVTKRTS